MIDVNKTYRTRDGREVRIYATDGGGDHAVHGSIKMNDGWRCTTWQADGLVISKEEHCADLIEVKPRIKRTVWLHVYRDATFSSDTRILRQMGNPFAMVKVEIDCEEGEGL
jgi:hypothetical protein